MHLEVDGLAVSVSNLSSFTPPWSSLLISHRCPPPTPVLWGPRVCEGWEALRCALPVGGPAVPVQQRVHADPRGPVGLQVILPRPRAGFFQPRRRPEQRRRRAGRRRADRRDRSGRRGARERDDGQLSRLRRQQQDGPNGCLHLGFLRHAVRVLQEQRHLHY